MARGPAELVRAAPAITIARRACGVGRIQERVEVGEAVGEEAVALTQGEASTRSLEDDPRERVSVTNP